jgi:hypothetical protein
MEKKKGPLRVKFSNHAFKRIRKRKLDYRHIEKMMYAHPCEDGLHEWEPPGTDIKIIYADNMRWRTVITAYEK